MIVIDTNSLIALIIGIIKNGKSLDHSKTSQFSVTDFKMLIRKIGNLSNLIVISNVWTEVDNHLNESFSSDDIRYYRTLRNLIKITTEQYIQTSEIIEVKSFSKLGVTDSLLLNFAFSTKELITYDHDFAAIAQYHGINVYNMKTEQLKSYYKDKRSRH